VYWPVEVMLPGPLLASPPETLQVTLAAPPPVSVAANCSTAAPLALAALHPLQLVSMAPVPGVIENAELEGSAVPCPAEQPAANSSAGAKSIPRILCGAIRRDNFPMHDSWGFVPESPPFFVACAKCSNGSSTFLGAMN
jgi:hypothetical protein